MSLPSRVSGRLPKVYGEVWKELVPLEVFDPVLGTKEVREAVIKIRTVIDMLYQSKMLDGQM